MPTKHESAKILVVDDSQVIRKTLNKRLQVQGYAVTEAKSGSEALERLKKEAFDLILLDVIMPDMDGNETLQEIRKLFGPAQLPVIMSTAMDQSDDMVVSFRLGASDYVTKPINFPVLQARVATQIALKRAADQLQQEIQERRQAQDELKMANESLERRVAERTADLQKAKDDMETQAEELARFNSELQDFAYVASHDLQEPLRKIQAFGDRLKSKFADALSDTGQDYIARMQSAADRMSELVSDLLSFSRVTTRARPFERVNLGDAAQAAFGEFASEVTATKAELELGTLPTIDADRSQIRQLLVNLIDNALKFRRPEVSPRIRIHAETAGGLCRLTVEDNGIGFDSKYTDRIFRVFQRLHGRGDYSGTGIGLAICRKLVERHGGSIEASGAPGEGASFTVTLPLRNTRSDPESNQPSDA